MRTAAALMIVLCWAARAPGAATKPSPPDPLIEAAAGAAEAGTLAAFAGSVEQRATEAMASPESADLPHLAQLAALREFGRWFGRVAQPSDDQRAALSWLVRQRRAAPALLLGATKHDPPDRVLAVLTALRKEHRDRLEQFPNLAAAICLVWDDPDRFGGEDRPFDPSRVVRVFKHYADNPALTRSAATELPLALLIFVVDNGLGDAEIDWVRRQYGQGVDIGETFFEVGYGPSRALSRDPPRPDADPLTLYTLANLRRFGGNLADQTYYAAQIGKTLGVPTAACLGLQREGQESQAWVAFADGRGRWDTTSGRYKLHYGSPGAALDPQTMEPVPEGELALTAGLLRTSSSKRAGATALCKLLDRAPAAQQLAALKRAVELSPSDRRVWRQVAAWGQLHKPGTDEHGGAVALVTSHLAPRSEEAALHVRLRMIEKLAADDRSAALAELRSAFGARADLVATIQLARARALLEKKDADGAFRVLGELLGGAEAVPAHAVDAMRLVDDILRERSELERLAGLYDQLWSRLRPPPQSPVAHTTAYWAIGQEYAQLLEELGRKHELERLRENLGQLWAEPVRR